MEVLTLNEVRDQIETGLKRGSEFCLTSRYQMLLRIETRLIRSNMLPLAPRTWTRPADRR